MKLSLAGKNRGRELSDFVESFPQPADISFVYARKPDFFTSLDIQGKQNQVVIAENESGTITSMGIRSIKPLFINGRKRMFGYLHGLKTAPSNRSRGEAARGYLYVKKLHEDKKTPAYLSTVLEQNMAVQDMFGKNRRFLPNHYPMGTFITYVLPIRRDKGKPKRKSIRIVRASEISFDQVIEFWNKTGRHRQFFPVYTKDDFKTDFCRGFDIGRLYAALEKGRIIGTLGAWDQRAFRQIYISRYSGLWRIGRIPLNSLLRIAGYPQLPSPGGELKLVYGAVMCIAENNVSVLRELIHHAREDLKFTGTQFFVMGLHEDDVLRKALERYVSVKYYSRLYVTGWKELQSFVDSLDRSLVPYLEVGTL